MRMLQESLLAHKYRMTLSDLLEDLRQDPEAIALFEEFHPGIWNDLAEQGYQCLALEQLPKAAQIFDFLKTIAPEEPAFHAAHADASAGMKQYMDAAEGYFITAELAPQVPDAHFYFAEIMLFFRHPEVAQESLEEAQMLMGDQPGHALASKSQQYMEFASQQINEANSKAA